LRCVGPLGLKKLSFSTFAADELHGLLCQSQSSFDADSISNHSSMSRPVSLPKVEALKPAP
ncbi:MAG TPA: hypothetical protein VF173_00325, partial [Thermoanaerobaculia bacterium]|nr:hypothetical protein [Thermoanaerobaculia bacterium]